MKPYNFCNNCGKQGHSYHQCKIPITSLGIITLALHNNDYKMLLICRKDSLGYVDFIRGRYNLENKQYIMNLIDIMTIKEKERILTTSFKDLWEQLWGNFVGIQYRGEETVAHKKFDTLVEGIQNGDLKYNLSSLVAESTSKWDTPEWGFPKGRRNFQEKDQDCAIREWEEETGYEKLDLDFITNILPYEENFTGSNFKSYKHKYYVAFMDNIKHKNMDNFQTTEVSELRWVTVSEAIKLIRPYNLERIKIVNLLNNVLKQYRLYR